METNQITNKFSKFSWLDNFVLLINKELHFSGCEFMEYLILHNDLETVIDIISKNSITYRNEVNKFDVYGNRYGDVLIEYLKNVELEFNNNLFIDHNHLLNFFTSFRLDRQRSGGYFYENNEIDLIGLENIENTLKLLKEAVIYYYNNYYNKYFNFTLQLDNGYESYLNFLLEERQLLHLFGISYSYVVNSYKFKRICNKNITNAYDLLLWVLRDMDGNNDILNFEESFLKRMKTRFGQNFEDCNVNNWGCYLLNYPKIRIKTEAFIKSGSFEKDAMPVFLDSNYRMFKHSKADKILISNRTFDKKIPWISFCLTDCDCDDKTRLESIIIGDSNSLRNSLFNSSCAVIKRINKISDGKIDQVDYSLEDQIQKFDIMYKKLADFGCSKSLMRLGDYYHSDDTDWFLNCK